MHRTPPRREPRVAALVRVGRRAVLVVLRFVAAHDFALAGVAPDDVTAVRDDGLVHCLKLQRRLTHEEPTEVLALKRHGAIELARTMGVDPSTVPYATRSTCDRSAMFMDHTRGEDRDGPEPSSSPWSGHTTTGLSCGIPPSVLRRTPRQGGVLGAHYSTERVVGVNLLSSEIGTSRSLVASGIVETFRKLWGQTLFGPRSEHLLRNAVLALLETPGTTLLHLLRLLVDETFRMRIVARVTDPVVRTFWLKEFPMFPKAFAAEVMAPVLNKLGALTAPAVRRVVGQVAPRLHLREVMDEGRILICDLSGIGRDAAELLGALVVTGLGIAAHARAGMPIAARRPFVLFADEFHAYMTASFAQLLAEGRKFGLCAVLAHQHLAQVEKEVRAAILGNAGTLVAFSLSAEDAEILAPEFEPYLHAEDLVRLRRYRIALRLLRHGELDRPTICYTIPPPPANGGPPATLLRISAERYGRPVEVVDREIEEALGTMA